MRHFYEWLKRRLDVCVDEFKLFNDDNIFSHFSKVTEVLSFNEILPASGKEKISFLLLQLNCHSDSKAHWL